MFFSVVLCLSVTFLNLVGHIRAHSVARYECGPHGTFEYCVDRNPGCVIGCHCHPGYYFDTETKICEPNTKLTDDYRRRYIGDANLIYPVNTPRPILNYPTQTTTSNAVEERIDEISKDTDDIGDWLYNQFFKAVEYQVIKNSSDETPLTRRSGNGGKFKPGSNLKGIQKKNKEDRKDTEWEPKHKTKRKTRKFLRGKGKNRKSKVHGLRRKLLRITEDDSLFDSESDDDSRGGGSDTSSSGSSDSSSSSGEGKDKGADNRDHGHKKVIIFNRRPRPPLPSFIFLPSMDTPYYPPIGLPPPPIMPMYPMVPVPPMAPIINVLDNGKNGTAAATVNCPSSDASPTTEAVTTTTTETTTSSTENSSPSSEASSVSVLRGDRRTKAKFHKSKRPVHLSDERISMRSGASESRMPALTSKQSERIKLLQKLKETLEMHNSKKAVQGNDEIENFDLMDLPEYKPQHNQKEVDDSVKDVNFKYLTELIHRQKLDDPTLNDNNTIKEPPNLPPSRRNYGEVPVINYGSEVTPSTHLDPNDAIYMNLGRQIASIIRDTNDKIHNNKANSLQESINSILNEKSYEPRSYWERFVRSPLNKLKTYLRELHMYKQSNEKDLLTLENQLQTFVSTVPPLSLHDLENMLTAVQKTYSEINKGNKFTKQSNTSLNVNLLPNKLIKEDIASRRMYIPLDNTDHMQLGNITSVFDQKEPTINEIQGLNPTNNGELMMDDWLFTARKLTPINKFNQESVVKPTRHNYLLLSNTSPKSVISDNKISENSEKLYLKFVNKLPVPVVKKPDPPSAYFDFLAQYPVKPTRYPKFPTKDAELSTKNLEVPANYPEQSVKYPELDSKYSEQPGKYQPMKYPMQSANNPELSVKYSDPSAIYSKPSAMYQDPSAKYPEPPTKYQELSAKYPGPSAKYPEQPEKYSDQYTYVNTPIKNPEQSATIPKVSVKYPDALVKYSEQFGKLADLSDKPVDKTANFAELPQQYVEISGKYPEQHAKYQELIESLPDRPENKYSEHSAKYPELIIKYPEVSDNVPELPEKQIDQSAKYFELPAKYPDLLTEFSELSRKTPELPSKYSDIPANYKEIVENSPDLLAKHSDLSAKYPELPTKNTDMPDNEFEEAVRYREPLVKHNILQGKPAPAIINYKSLNYFSGAGNKRHYLFRATYPGYKKMGSNIEGQKPSYFHHEFHHFDYFE